MRIEAYYTGLRNANNAVNKFKNEGFSNATVDLNDNYIDFENYKYNFSDAILNSSSFSDISDGFNNGMGNSQDMLNFNYKVAINSTSTEDSERIKELIRETGGHLKTPTAY